MESRSKKLRSGYTTGACAAAAAKAATLLLMNAACGLRIAEQPDGIEIPLPNGDRVTFKIHNSEYRLHDNTAFASVVKDAGDDPDVTNGAEIAAEAALNGDWGVCQMRIAECGLRKDNSQIQNPKSEIILKGGIGVGRVTKPGLSVPVGEPAINPVPRRMILEAVNEAISECGTSQMRIADCGLRIDESEIGRSEIPKSEFRNPQLVITISVPKGEELAKKTLNARLGIVGGISILGTTGIVRPLSTAAWTASITASMDVARAMGCGEVVISAGRTSERAHMKKFKLPEEAYVMMGDYLEFSLSDAKKHGFRKIHLCAQWAKMLKIALSTPQTHVRHGALDVARAVELLNDLGIPVPREREFNTAREIYDFINSSLITHHSSLFLKVCGAAKGYAEGLAQTPVAVHLVSYEGAIIAGSE